MKSFPSSTPIQKVVLLVGAGNAHLVFVRRWRMRPLPGVMLVLVNEASSVPYSAMVPAHISGAYPRDDITIDLVRLCRSADVRLVSEAVVGLDCGTRQVHFTNRPPLTYDVLSLGLGSMPRNLATPCEPDTTIPLRPLATLLDRLAVIEARLFAHPSAFHLAIVGGGASGCELALAIHNRLGHLPDFRISIMQADDRLVPRFPSKTAHHFEKAFERRGIQWRVGTRVVGGESDALMLESGERLSCNAVLWATPGSPPALLGNCGLSTDERGFLRVTETLQTEADPTVFGTGDCVSFRAFPDLARSGVHAVRQGAVLVDNVMSFLKGGRLRAFRPQRRCLYLLNAGDSSAVLNYGPFACKARWVRKLKDWIDQRWVASFLPPEMASTAAEADAEKPLMRCGGCGSKISGDVLSAVLKRLDPPHDPRLLIGSQEGEDAAVYRGPANGPLEVQTIDYFRAFLDDPYLVGRIAALHAVSDLYAMNARPNAALAVATLPYARGPVQEQQLFELLAGAQRSLTDSGVTLGGGHTTEGHELAVGFAVTGYAEEEQLFRKGNLKPGDQLVLTKPLGTGALLAAWMRAQCRAEWLNPLIASMVRSNRDAATVVNRMGLRACTDITGFGLAGHLLEMLRASRVSATLEARQIPLLPGFLEVVSQGIVSTLHRDNAKLACRICGPDPLPAWMFDPQTSGGLLIGVAPQRLQELLSALHANGDQAAAVIGAVHAENEPTITLIE